MKELVHLKMIISRLDNYEIMLITDNLYVENKKNIHTKVAFKLFNILNTNEVVDFARISNLLYGEKNEDALKKLAQRLTEKILDILISKENLRNNELFDVRGKEIFVIRRKLLYYDILAAYGITEYALIILNQIIAAAKKIEAYDYLIIALEKKLIKMSLRFGSSNYNKVFSEIKYYTDCNYSLKESMYLLRLYSSNYEYKQKVISNSNLEKVIDKIKVNYLRTNSKSIRINLAYLQSIYYFNNGEYIKCRIVFSSLYSFLKLNSNFVFRSYLITCLINMAEIETMLWNFELSLKHLYKVINQFKRNQFNDNLIQEMIFLNYFYNGGLENSFQIISKLVNTASGKNISSFINSKRKFYMAAIKFIFNLYHESNKLLSDCKELDKDKGGWNIGVRLLTILNSIELEKFQLAEAQIENLRKHIARVEGGSVFFNRSELILKILINLCNCSFDFNKANLMSLKILNQLSGEEKRYLWQIKCPEMIIFHEWFYSKVKNIPYDHIEVMKRLKKKNKALR